MNIVKGLSVIAFCIVANLAMAGTPALGNDILTNNTDSTKVTYSLFNFFYEFTPKKDSAVSDKKSTTTGVKKPTTSGK